MGCLFLEKPYHHDNSAGELGTCLGLVDLQIIFTSLLLFRVTQFLFFFRHTFVCGDFSLMAFSFNDLRDSGIEGPFHIFLIPTTRCEVK